MAQGTRTISWKSGKTGATVSVTLAYESSYIPSRLIDEGWEGSTKATIYVKRTTTLTIGDKAYKDCGDVREINEQNLRIQAKETRESLEKVAKQGATHYVAFHDAGNYRVFCFDNCPYDEIQAAWDTLIAEVDDADVKKFKDVEAAKERQADINRAEHIMSLEATTRKYFKGNLPTSAELRAWEKKYNDFYNEGGEGYIPELVTQPQVDWATEILSK